MAYKGVVGRMVEHQREYGGTLGLITGPQGSGKTTYLLRLGLMLMERGETVIWRGRTLAQWPLIWDKRPDLVNVFTPERCIYQFSRVKGNKKKPLEVELEPFKGHKDLLEKVEPGKLNVVYPDKSYTVSYIKETENGEKEMEAQGQEYFWFELLNTIKRRSSTRWMVVLFDEADDLAPEHPKGIRWRYHEELKNSVKDYRKAFSSLYLAVHNQTDLDMRIRGKMQFHIYLRGARVSKTSMVKPGLVRRLKVGQAIVEDNAEFERMHYSKFKKPKYQVLAEQKRAIKAGKYSTPSPPLN